MKISLTIPSVNQAPAHKPRACAYCGRPILHRHGWNCPAPERIKSTYSTAWGKQSASTGNRCGSTRRACPRPGGEKTGPDPTNRGKRGSNRHLAVDGEGVPLALVLTAANVHDSRALEELVDAITPIQGPRGKPGRPRKRPEKLHADKGYDFPPLPPSTSQTRHREPYRPSRRGHE